MTLVAPRIVNDVSCVKDEALVLEMCFVVRSSTLQCRVVLVVQSSTGILLCGTGVVLCSTGVVLCSTGVLRGSTL